MEITHSGAYHFRHSLISYCYSRSNVRGALHFGLFPALGLYGVFVGRLLEFRYGKQLRELHFSFVFFALEERDDGVGLFARSDFRLFSTKASNFFL